MLSGLAMSLFSSGRNAQSANYVLFMKRRIGLLQMLGLRYIVTDERFQEPEATLVETMTREGLSLYLYELALPNLGDYSPTEPVRATSVEEAVTIMNRREFDPKRHVVFTRDTPTPPFVPAHRSVFSFGQNEVTVRASAPGRSLVLLPLGFSNCWTVHPASGGAGDEIVLHRANLAMTAIEFTGELDATLTFDFDPLGKTECRRRDLAEYEALNWTYFRSVSGKDQTGGPGS